MHPCIHASMHPLTNTPTLQRTARWERHKGEADALSLDWMKVDGRFAQMKSEKWKVKNAMRKESLHASLFTLHVFFTLLDFRVNRRTQQEQKPSSLGVCLARRRTTKFVVNHQVDAESTASID